MARPLTLFTGQWADLKFDVLCKKAKKFGYDGIELPCWGDHFEVSKALEDRSYCKRKWEVLQKNGLTSYAISAHLVGQAVCDLIDERHKSILPPHVWGDGKPEGVRTRAAAEMMDTARAACHPQEPGASCGGKNPAPGQFRSQMLPWAGWPWQSVLSGRKNAGIR